ncbi:hypothetical protein GE061_012515 [Apolygus lucorum]|uniref:Peptidase S1 domain-containing protein n=1 Tax=Apolygus lucorum TaxID=248454 RepID=A0A6A4K0I0_APOLU|nr:hypothetical protein GE061_012515 [Apolygus lucorum]
MFHLYALVSFIPITISTEITPTHLDDPDTWIPLEPPHQRDSDEYWSTHSRQADATGLLLAGGSEFPWIVDIRLASHDQEYWAVGNLITYYHVITTCRAMWRFLGGFPWDSPAKTFVRSRIKDATVNFCTNYLWEGYDVEKPLERGGRKDAQSGGTRFVQGITLHVQCSINSLEHDISVIELRNGIHPTLPGISYMPIPENKNTGEIAEANFQHQLEFRWVCYIASFGKSANNVRNSMDIDYKVKYRVYYMKWSDCQKYFDRLCPTSFPFCDHWFTKDPHDRLMCFRPHAKVGAVCDHDIGSPLVCDGFVFGMVVRGVDFHFCHNLTPFPAIVRRTDFLKEFIADVRFEFNQLIDTDPRFQSSSDHQNSSWALIIIITGVVTSRTFAR